MSVLDTNLEWAVESRVPSVHLCNSTAGFYLRRLGTLPRTLKKIPHISTIRVVKHTIKKPCGNACAGYLIPARIGDFLSSLNTNTPTRLFTCG